MPSKVPPKTEFNGATLTFDFPSFQIGVAEYPDGPTGCTLFYFSQDAQTAVDIRGGSPGTIGNYEWSDAICWRLTLWGSRQSRPEQLCVGRIGI